MSSLPLLTALIAGLAGGAHCFGMCGGMAGALGMRARTISKSTAQASLHGSLYHVGRICGYASIGAIGGTFGHSAHWMLDLTRFESALRIAAGVLTVLVAIRILWRWNAFAPIERVGARLWQMLQPWARRASLNEHWLGSVLTGLLWGWLPCGLVYSMVLLTLTTGSAIEGATVMLAFGIGTLPAMASSTVLLGAWPRLTQRPWFRAGTGTLLLLFGVWMMHGPQVMHAAGGHGH